MSTIFHELARVGVGDWAQVAGALFTAVAAGGAWRTVTQGRRMMRAAVEPDVHLQVLGDVVNDRTHVVIANIGGGATKLTAYQVVSRGRRAGGFLGDGFLAPGDKVLVELDAPADDNAEAQVLYLTADDSSWVVTRDGRKRRLRKGRKGAVTTGDEAWTTMHPDVPWKDVPSVGVHVQWIEKRGILVARNPSPARGG